MQQQNKEAIKRIRSKSPERSVIETGSKKEWREGRRERERERGGG